VDSFTLAVVIGIGLMLAVFVGLFLIDRPDPAKKD